MTSPEIETIEIHLLLDAMYQRYGYDFRSYSRASVERRVRQFLSKSGCATISEMISKLLWDESFFSALVQYLSISVTEMFRDPFVYRSIRKNVIPVLRTYPFVRIWHAGCATGEEVYSMAIVMKEEGLHERAVVFGTDFNDAALKTAKDGIYPLDQFKSFTKNYQQAGGTASFSEYYHAKYDSATIHPSLKEHVTFANHNLVTDGVFGEKHLVLCRNVLIYFNRELQSRALRLFTDSLVRGGFLCLGSKEDLQFTDVADEYEIVDAKAKIYRKSIVGARSES